jgi:hypothetical protein
MKKRKMKTRIPNLLVAAGATILVILIWVTLSFIIFLCCSSPPDYNQKCLSTVIRSDNVDCSNPYSCSLTLTRIGKGNDEIGGVKLIFRNETGRVISPNAIDPGVGNLNPSESKKVVVNSGIDAPNSVEVTVYFRDSHGNERVCSQTTSYNF